MEPTETDMANTAIMLNEAVDKRIAEALIKLLDGTDSPHWHVASDGNNQLDRWQARSTITSALMETIKMELEQLIRQEIANAFAQSSSCTQVVNMGDTLHVDLGLTVRT